MMEYLHVHQLNLMLSLTGFGEAVHKAVAEYAPHKICSFVYELADEFNSFYHDNKIVTQEDKAVQKEWVALIVMVLEALEICMDLLVRYTLCKHKLRIIRNRLYILN